MTSSWSDPAILSATPADRAPLTVCAGARSEVAGMRSDRSEAVKSVTEVTKGVLVSLLSLIPGSLQPNVSRQLIIGPPDTRLDLLPNNRLVCGRL